MKCPKCGEEMQIWLRDTQNHLYITSHDVAHWHCSGCGKWILWTEGDK